MRLRACLLVPLCLSGWLPAEAQMSAGTAFTYQGRLDDGGSPASGPHDLQLVLYTAATGGAQVGPVLVKEDVVVTGGLFTVSLDFGAGAFAGSVRFLEVGVRPGASTGSFTILSPRQELTPAPHAVFASSIPLAGSGSTPSAAHSDHDHAGTYALTAHTHNAADLTSGTVSFARLSGAYGGVTGVGTLTSGTWNSTPIGPLFGGTAQSTYVAGDLLFAPAANTLGRRAIGSSGQVLSVAGGVPVWLDAGTHDHLGQTWSTTSALHGLQVTSSSTLAGSALRGVHTGASGVSAGVQGFNAQDVSGAAGVHGVAATPSAAVSGVFGEAVSTSGRGVFGAATAGSGLTYGVYGTVNSPTGWGLFTPNRAFVGTSLGIGAGAPASALHVVGQGRFETGSGSPPLIIPTAYAPGQTVTNLSADRLDGLDFSAFALSVHDHLGQAWAATSGGFGLSVANSSTAAGSAGLLGDATSSSAVTYGVFGRAASSAGRGVFGQATSTTGGAIGVRGQSAADNGTGVHGFASSGVGTTTGVRGDADSVLGRGVAGEAFSPTGITYGVYGNASSPDGWGLFTPGRAHAASLAVGTLTPVTALDVAGQGRFAVAPGTPPLVVPTAWGNGATVTNLSADRLDGLDATAFAQASQLGSYVAKAGDTMTGALTLGAAGTGLSVAHDASLSGQVGIGTAPTAASRVTILADGGTEIRFPASPDNADVFSAGSVLRIGTETATSLLLLTNSLVRFAILGPNGNVGIGTVSPSDKLEVEASGAPAARFDRTTSDGVVVNIARDGVIQGSISVSGTTVSYNAFTGSHYAWTNEPLEHGWLVSLTGDNQRLHDRPGSEPIYGVAATARANDPAVLGAYLGRLEPGRADAPVTENPHLVAAVGNGELWVADTGADIAPGDPLVSSAVPGHAMKDDDRFAVSFVVARAAERVAWKDVTETLNGVRHRRISVLFESHVTEKTAGLAAELADLAARVVALEGEMRAGRPDRRETGLARSGERP